MHQGRTVWQRFNKLLKGAGIPKGSLHSLRHTFATMLYAQTNGDAKLVCRQLRQADPGFTTRTYIHQSPQRTNELLQNFRF